MRNLKKTLSLCETPEENTVTEDPKEDSFTDNTKTRSITEDPKKNSITEDPQQLQEPSMTFVPQKSSFSVFGDRI